MSNPQESALNKRRSNEHGSSAPETQNTDRVGEVHTTGVLPEGTVDAIYEAKAGVLNDAIQKIGMGKYQWHLFVVTGFGWFADNL